MADNRGRIILAALAIAESIWIYGVLAVVGLLSGMGGSPLTWFAVFALYVTGMFIGWLTMGLRGNKATLAILEGLIGITIIYLVVASGTFYEGRSFDMAWPAKLTGADLEAKAVAGVIFSLLAAVYVWRKTIGIVADDYASDRLQRSFKIGIAVIAVGVLAEQISKTDVGIQTLLVPFFAASLAGLAAARLPEHGLRGKGAAWARIIAAAILGVIALGLILGLLGGIYGGVGVRLLYRGWGLLVDTLLWILRYPLELLVTLMLLIFNWLKSMFGSEEQPEQEFGGGPPGGLPEGITETAGDSQLFETIFNIIQYPLLAVLIIGLFLFLALAYRKFIARQGRGEDEDRESLDTDADPTKDLMRLLAGLLPSWFTRSSEKPRRWRYPENEVGVTEVFLLYFDYLSACVSRGLVFTPNLTPNERVPDMQLALPGARVGLVTELFNAACYGHVSANRSTVDQLKSELAAFIGPAAPGSNPG